MDSLGHIDMCLFRIFLARIFSALMILPFPIARPMWLLQKSCFPFDLISDEDRGRDSKTAEMEGARF